jgi:hypothetical protein
MKVVILLAAILSQVLDAFKEYKKQNKKEFKEWLMLTLKMFVIGGLGFLTISELVSSNSEKEIAETHGELTKEGRSDTTSPMINFGTLRATRFRHLVSFSDNSGPFDIKVTNSQIIADVNIRDWDGETIATFNSNQWHVFAPSVDYNNDAHGFEVVRPDGQVIFQADYREGILYCNGLLCSDIKNTCILGDENSTRAPLHPPAGRSKYWLPDDTKITPLFRYPRYQYFGVRAK